MLKINIKKYEDYKVNNKERYIYVENYYASDLPDINDINIIKDLDSGLLYDYGYQNLHNGIFVDILSCFNSFIELGKNIYETSIFNSIDEINYENKNVSKKYEIVYKMVYEWIKLNGNPYNYINPMHSDLKDILPKDRIMQFVYDCLICYSFYQINTSLLWLDNNDDEDEDENSIQANISNIEKFIRFTNLSNMCKEVIDDLYIINYEEFNDYDLIISDLEHLEENNIGTSEYQISINRILICIIAHTVIYRRHDFLITNQKPIYIKNLMKYSLFENAESLTGIAYHQLLLNLTAGELPYNIRRCKNPNCSIMFHSRYRQQYCNKLECQKYRKNKKSYDYYHRPTKNKKKNQKKAKNK